MQMTQHKLIIEYVKKHGSILPAKMGGRIFLKTMFGSETPKRCRELCKRKLLDRNWDGKFKRFSPTENLKKIIIDKS